MQNTEQLNTTASPFSLNNKSSEDLYKRWRDKKLASHPQNIADLLVEVKDPRSLSSNEYNALLGLTQRANMAIYVGTTGTDPSPEIPMAVANKFGLGQINKNWLADDNGLTSLTVVNAGIRKKYIPYTNKLIHWHTDGYYNDPDKQIHA
ncbi:MAG: taurine catabolism dioxygenase TauD, partial [Candidatus Thioglobus sp.]|nr:taurine catabolism dioxygenase TauD [Candidatus Thioglobus sp.]MBT6327154.1 taurine catabolism dioxygenase TauD [Candidatus Thioglobus sp.]MBT7411970.1 taurine catabolism dioxygenase TauD [Candidatus Thioglobus sp.]